MNPPLGTSTSNSSSRPSQNHRLGSSKNFSSNSSIGSQMSTVGPLLNTGGGSRFSHDLSTAPSFVPHEPSRDCDPSPPTSSPARLLSVSSTTSSTHHQQQAIEALTVRRFSSSEASVDLGGQGLSAEDALMVNKLRKAATRPGTFFRLNTINSSEFGSNPNTPKVTSRLNYQPYVFFPRLSFTLLQR